MDAHEFLSAHDQTATLERYRRGLCKTSRRVSIPTPVGDYRPDWAIFFKHGSVKHIYFVAETKGTMSSMKLREIEKTKIECARKFFDGINKHIQSEKVKYEVVTDFGKLMDIVGLKGVPQ